MKRLHVIFLTLVLCVCTLCLTSCSSEHEHTAGKFISSDGRHRKECLTCGEVLFSTPCSYQKTSLGPQGHATACEVCGHVKKAEEAHEIRQSVRVTNDEANTGEAIFACQECDYTYTLTAGYVEDFTDPSSLNMLDIQPKEGHFFSKKVEDGVLTMTSQGPIISLNIHPKGALTNDHQVIVGLTVRAPSMMTSIHWWVNNGVNTLGFATDKVRLTTLGKFLHINKKVVGEIDDYRFTSIVIYAKLTERPGNAVMDIRFYVDGVHVGSGSAIVLNRNENKQIGPVSFCDDNTYLQVQRLRDEYFFPIGGGNYNREVSINIDSIFVADVPADFGELQK